LPFKVRVLIVTCMKRGEVLIGVRSVKEAQSLAAISSSSDLSNGFLLELAIRAEKSYRGDPSL